MGRSTRRRAARLTGCFDSGSYLYAIRGAGMVKLGRARNVQDRLRTLQVGSPVKLVVVVEVPESLVTEEEAHAAWEHIRSHGEWFHLTPELEAWLERLKRERRTRRTLHERAHRIAFGPERRRLARLVRVERLLEMAAAGATP